jgi:hypothetical protein
MAELTEQQIEQAANAGAIAVGAKFVDMERARKIYRAAAPFLQLQLDKPTEKELDYLTSLWGASQEAAIRESLIEFVRLRTASRTPQLVDPRTEAICKVLHAETTLSTPGTTQREVATKILAAIGEVK